MSRIAATFVSIGALLGGVTAGIPCVIDCAAGTSSGFYQFNPGDAVIDEIGGGRGADMVLGLLAQTGNPVYFSAAAPTYSALPGVVHTGSGPAVTAALVPGGPAGPLDYHHHKLTITQPGPNGVAQFSAAYDYAGSTVVDTFPVPIESAATLIGTVAITPTTLALAPGLTLVFVTPAVETLTLAAPSLSGAAAGLMAATATVTGGASYTSANYLTGGVSAILANPRKLRWTTAGATAAHVPAAIALTGFDYAGLPISETIVPSTTAGDVLSVHAYASFSWSYAAAGGTDATLAVGYEAAYATPAELLAELNTVALAAPITVTATSVQTGAGAFLTLATNLLTSGAGGTGLSATVSLNASPGTAAALFGFANGASATGLGATFAPPWTNVVWSFPVGVYGADTYELLCTGPEPSTSAITAAMTVARAAWKTSPFGFFAVTAHPSSVANSVGLQAACTALVNAWRTDSSCPVACFTGTPFHTMSPVRATNDVNITTNDTAIANAWAAAPAALDSVGGDDCFVAGDPSLRSGSYRRSAVFAMAVKAATLSKLGANLAESTVQGVSMRGPDLLSYARDESTAVVKLGPTGPGAFGLGFCVLVSTPTAPVAAKFAGGVTRAGNGSNYRSCGTVFVALYISQVCFTFGFGWLGQSWETSKVPKTLGQLTQHIATTMAAIVQRALADVLTPDGKDPSISGAIVVTIDNSGNFESLGIVPLIPVFMPLGEVQAVKIVVIASSNGTGTTTGLSP